MDFRDQIDELSEEEFVQIRSAATWYAKFHARIIAERLDDRSAMAVGQRGRYEALISGLRKVGARVFDPTVPVTSLLPPRDAEEDPAPDSQRAA
ncbi:MAG TPA: hypothetical protein VIY71_09200 [Solirubrobacterales bacterium]